MWRNGDSHLSVETQGQPSLVVLERREAQQATPWMAVPLDAVPFCKSTALTVLALESILQAAFSKQVALKDNTADKPENKRRTRNRTCLQAKDLRIARLFFDSQRKQKCPARQSRSQRRGLPSFAAMISLRVLPPSHPCRAPWRSAKMRRDVGRGFSSLFGNLCVLTTCRPSHSQAVRPLLSRSNDP